MDSYAKEWFARLSNALHLLGTIGGRMQIRIKNHFMGIVVLGLFLFININLTFAATCSELERNFLKAQADLTKVRSQSMASQACQRAIRLGHFPQDASCPIGNCVELINARSAVRQCPPQNNFCKIRAQNVVAVLTAEKNRVAPQCINDRQSFQAKISQQEGVFTLAAAQLRAARENRTCTTGQSTASPRSNRAAAIGAE